MPIKTLKDFAANLGIKLKIQKAIVEEATENITKNINTAKIRLKRTLIISFLR